MELAPDVRAERLLRHALALYKALGGDLASVSKIAAELDKTSLRPIDESVARVTLQLAAISHTIDIDLVQASYNLLDAQGITKVKLPTPKRGKKRPPLPPRGRARRR